MHDIVIRGGTIVDGTGAPAFQGDVAIDGDRIVQVGGKAGPGKREVKAEGRLVTPGWVDVHTHYDGQVYWDPLMTPSSWHGATTAIMGNCGVGFAPARPDQHVAAIPVVDTGLAKDCEAIHDNTARRRHLARLRHHDDIVARRAFGPIARNIDDLARCFQSARLKLA